MRLISEARSKWSSVRMFWKNSRDEDHWQDQPFMSLECERASCIGRFREESQHAPLNKHFKSDRKWRRILGRPWTLDSSHFLRAVISGFRTGSSLQMWSNAPFRFQGIGANLHPPDSEKSQKQDLPTYVPHWNGDLLVCCWPTFQTWGKSLPG